MLRPLYYWGFLGVFVLLIGVVLAGCGTTPGSSYAGNGGVGADAGPWPANPNQSLPDRNAGSSPNVPLTVVLHATAAEHAKLSLQVVKVELNYEKQWITVNAKNVLDKLQPMPWSVGDTGGTALLANTQVPRRNYTAIRLVFNEAKTTVTMKPETPALPLKVNGAMQSLEGWVMDPKQPNTVTFTLDGTKITAAASSANVPEGALAISKGMPTGAISGKLTPYIASAKIQLLWGTSDYEFASATPLPPDGVFAIKNVPAGMYRVKVISSSHHLIDDLSKPMAVGEKEVALGELHLAENSR
ncbi:MAG TPA: hypothetical protein VGL77_05045 [Armatimonadota bacterium]